MSKIVFLGDSITKATDYGGVTQAQAFAQKIGIANGYLASEIINAGASGDGSTSALARLSSDVIAHNPAVCVVMLGLNDFAQSVSVATYEQNITSIFESLLAANIKPVGMTTAMQRGSTADFQNFKPYLIAFENACAVHRVPICDLYREMATAYLYLSSADFLALYVDLVHLTVAGHQFVADLSARDRFAGVFTV